MDDTIHQEHMDNLRKELDLQYQNEVNNLQNSFTNERTNFNNQLQQKQNEVDQMRISLDAERNTFNNQLQQKQNEISNAQNSFTNERTNFNNQLQQKQGELDQIRNDLTVQIQQRDTNIQDQTNTVASKDNELQSQRNKILQLQTDQSSFETEKIAKNSEISELRGKVEMLEKKNQELDRQNQEKNESIIDTLSDHYDTYVSEAVSSQTFWFRMVIVSFTILIALTVFSYYSLSQASAPKSASVNITVNGAEVTEATTELAESSRNNSIYEWVISIFRAIMFDILAICFLWFCMSRFSYFTKLITEYRNRSIVSKSYLGVIYNTKDEQVKNEATRIVADTLFARCSVEIGSELPLKEAIKILGDVTKR